MLKINRNTRCGTKAWFRKICKILSGQDRNASDWSCASNPDPRIRVLPKALQCISYEGKGEEGEEKEGAEEKKEGEEKAEEPAAAAEETKDGEEKKEEAKDGEKVEEKDSEEKPADAAPTEAPPGLISH